MQSVDIERERERQKSRAFTAAMHQSSERNLGKIKRAVLLIIV